LVSVLLESAESAEDANNETICYTLKDSTQLCLSMTPHGANSSVAEYACKQRNATLMRVSTHDEVNMLKMYLQEMKYSVHQVGVLTKPKNPLFYLQDTQQAGAQIHHSSVTNYALFNRVMPNACLPTQLNSTQLNCFLTRVED
jgi:hypothetical protein